MPIETKCPGCGRGLRVDDQYAGRQARCPVCNTIYVVPGGDAPAPEQGLSEGSGRWYMRTPEGRVYGPVSKLELDRWLSEGRISVECSLREGEEAQWRSADEFYGVLSAASQRQASPGSPFVERAGGSPAASAASAGATRTAFGTSSTGVYYTPHRGGLILAFGIMGWVFSCPIFSVMAWVMGNSDLREMRSGRMDSRGMGLTQAGHVLGVIYTLLWILVFVIVTFVALLAFVARAVH
jgi:hypothetical protein